MKRTARLVSIFLASLIGLSAQQVADPNFDASVARPAYTDKHPKVLCDEAHRNFHTTTGRYKPFVNLITNDGYQVTPMLFGMNRPGLDNRQLALNILHWLSRLLD